MLSSSVQTLALAPGGRIPWVGRSWYLNGVNYPWVHYGNDFGGNAWGAYGVHEHATGATVDADFARMEQRGVRSVRWWLFADGRAGIRWDSNGMPVGVDDYVYPDLDSALALALKHHLYLELVLTDYLLLNNAKRVNGVQVGGRASVISVVAGQQALVAKVFKPLFQRYGRNQQILAYQVMNEPEWAIREDHSGDPRISQPVSLATFQRFTRDVASSVHTHTRSYVTLGSAAMRWVRQWQGLGLDFYSIHYYDWMHQLPDADLYDADYSAFRLDAPVVVGEYPPGGKTADFHQYMDNWFNRGYAGAWVWSLKAVDGVGAPDIGVMGSWNSAHAAVTDIRGRSTSPPSPSCTMS
jgi:hypothetical protein